jgi:hypothetical protein
VCWLADLLPVPLRFFFILSVNSYTVSSLIVSTAVKVLAKLTAQFARSI